MAAMKDRFALALEARGKDPMDVVRGSGLSKATVYWIQDGTTKAESIRADTAFRVCEALAISPRWLVHGKGEMDDGVSQSAGLDRKILAETFEILRKAFAMKGLGFSPESDVDLVVDTYTQLLNLGDLESPENLVDFGRWLTDRQEIRATATGEGNEREAGGVGKHDRGASQRRRGNAT